MRRFSLTPRSCPCHRPPLTEQSNSSDENCTMCREIKQRKSGGVCNVLVVGYVLLNQVLVINERMPLMSLLYQMKTAASTKARRIVQVQSWHKDESMLKLEDEEGGGEHVAGPFYTPLFRA